MQGDNRRMVRPLLAESVCEPSKPAHLHPRGEILALDIGRAVIRSTLRIELPSTKAEMTVAC